MLYFMERILTHAFTRIFVSSRKICLGEIPGERFGALKVDVYQLGVLELSEG